MAKTAQNLQGKFKITDFLLGSDFMDFFVGIGLLHVSTELCTCMWNIARGARHWNSIGGAIEPFATPTSENIIRCKCSPLLVCFQACLSPQKSDFGEEEETEQFQLMAFTWRHTLIGTPTWRAKQGFSPLTASYFTQIASSNNVVKHRY